jgi:carboxynorspermidine decarboxylase
LARDYFGDHVHLYAPAYSQNEFPELVALSERITFNSLSQWALFKEQALNADVSCGLRVNPRVNEVAYDLYNPCSSESRLGIPEEELTHGVPAGIEGIHVHALCESGADATERLIQAVEKRFSHLLPNLKWCNLGGGHLMTQSGYDLERLIRTLQQFRLRHPHLEVVLEPGSAIAWRSGPLISTVLDIITRGGIKIALLDTSATAHMPDVLEMPYRPEVRGAFDPNAKPYTYRFGGLTCLAGDIIGDYSFEQSLKVGERIIFEDMIHYTMVKTTMFNGVVHPSIALLHEDDHLEVIRKFNYTDYKNRLS